MLPDRPRARYDDPLARVDWPSVAHDCWWLPPAALALAGVPEFEALPLDVRRRVSRAEYVHLVEAGLWLESMFMARLVSIARASDLRVFDMEDIGPHYATTLAHWRQNFRANLPKIRALGYDETFIRMWEYYFCYCEGGFAERVLGDVQMLLVKPRNRRATL